MVGNSYRCIVGDVKKISWWAIVTDPYWAMLNESQGGQWLSNLMVGNGYRISWRAMFTEFNGVQ